VMKNVELTQLIVDEDHVAWAVTVGYGWSYETLMDHDILSRHSNFFIGKRGWGEEKKDFL
jgi:hypothetical protein